MREEYPKSLKKAPMTQDKSLQKPSQRPFSELKLSIFSEGNL
jgi:hypothetical protein